MTVAIRQEANFADFTADPLSGCGDPVSDGYGWSGIVRLHPDDYSDETVYFEVVAKNSDASASVVYFAKWNGASRYSSPAKSISIPASTSAWTRFRSTAATLDGSYPYWNFYSPDSSYVSIIRATAIILQSADNITDTVTQIEIGCQATIVPGSASTWYYMAEEAGEPKYWKYEASKWDPTPEIYLAVTFGCEDDMESYSFGLYDVTDSDYGGGNLDDLITGCSQEAPRYYESATDIQSYLEDGHVYCLAYWSDDNRDDMYFLNAKLMIYQSDEGGITKLQNEYLMVNDGNVTGDQEVDQLYDTAEWDGVDLTIYHEHSASGATSSSKLEDSGGDITDSAVTGAGLQRSSAISLDDDEEIFTDVTTAG